MSSMLSIHMFGPALPSPTDLEEPKPACVPRPKSFPSHQGDTGFHGCFARNMFFVPRRFATGMFNGFHDVFPIVAPVLFDDHMCKHQDPLSVQKTFR